MCFVVWFPSTAGGVGGVTAIHHWCSDSLPFMLHVTLPHTVAMVTASFLTCGYDVYVKRERFGIYKSMCMWFVLHKWVGGVAWGTSHKQPLPPWTCPSDDSSSSASSCLHCTKRPVSFHRRRLILSLSPVSHSEHVKPRITAHSKGTHTPERQQTSAFPALMSLVCFN